MAISADSSEKGGIALPTSNGPILSKQSASTAAPVPLARQSAPAAAVPDEWKKAELQERGIGESSLFRIVYSADEKTAYNLIGHRCATLIPVAKKGDWPAYDGDIDDDAIVKGLKDDPPTALSPDSEHDLGDKVRNAIKKSVQKTAVSIAEGADAKDHMVIQAEDLVVYRGSRFSFPGKTLTIFARRVIIVPRAGETLGSKPEEHQVIFDCCGADAEDKFNPQDSKAKGKANDGGGSRDDGDTLASPGNRGDNGDKGVTGSNAGNIFFCGQVVSMCPGDDAVALRLMTVGGKGSQGQKGGEGGRGGNGGFYVYWMKRPKPMYQNGQAGGAGGDGGAGGNGGSGGDVHLRTTGPPLTSPSRFIMRPIAQPSEVGGGQNGPSGQGGSGGSGGSGGKQTSKNVFSKDVVLTGWAGSWGGGGSSSTANAFAAPAGQQTSLQNYEVGAFALAVNPAFAHMLVQRLTFEYDILFGSFFDASAKKGKSAERRRFETSLAWAKELYDTIKALKSTPALVAAADNSRHAGVKDYENQEKALRARFGAAWNDSRQKASREIFILAFEKLLSLGGSALPMVPAVDSYGQSFRYIPDTSFSLNRLIKAAVDLEVIEERRKTLSAADATAKAKASEAAGLIQGYSQAIADNAKNQSKAAGDVNEAQKKADGLRTDLQAALKDCTAKVKSLQPKLKANLSCDNVEKILGSVASCMMFTPQARGVALAGNFLSVGSASSDLFNTVETNGGTVKTDVIKGQFNTIDAKLSGKDLTKQISDLATGSSDRLVKTVMLEQSRFEKLCDDHFPGDASAEQRAAFDTLLDKAKAFHEAVLETQKASLRQAQVEAYYTQAKVAQAALQSDTSTTPALKPQIFLQIYDESYSQQKSRVVKYYLDAIRAITALKLESTSLSRSLLQLGCWDNLSGQLFNDVVVPQLRAENDVLRARNNRFTTISTAYKGWITKEKYPGIFGYKLDGNRTLAKVGSLKPFNFQIDATNCRDILGIDLNAHFDVRMKQCWVVLEGARLKKEGDTDLTIDVNVAFTGAFWVTTGKTAEVVDDATGTKSIQDVELQFEIDKVQTGSRFKYDKQDAKKTVQVAREDQPKARMVALDDSIPDLFRPVQSPLAEWSIWWNQDLIDVSGVERIQLVVDATYRAREHPRVAKRQAVGGPSPTNFQMIPKMEPCPHLASIHDTFQFPPSSAAPRVGGKVLYRQTLGGSGNVFKGLLLRFANARTLSRTSLGGRFWSSFAGTIADIGFTNHRVISDPEKDPFRDLGATPKEKANNTHSNQAAYVSGIGNLFDHILENASKVNPQDKFNTLNTSFHSNGNHTATIAGFVKLDPSLVKNLKLDDPTILWVRLMSIPIGARLLTGKHAKAMKEFDTAADRYAYVKLYSEEILKDEQEFLSKPNRDFNGTYVQLGNSGIIGFDNLHITRRGKWVIISGAAYTTSYHALDGVNTWAVAINVDDPSVMVLFNHLEGVAALRLSDQVNCVGGEHLMGRTMADFALHFEAMQTGKTVEQVLATKPTDFQKSYRQAKTMWRIFDAGGVLLAGARALLGSNMAYEKLDTRVLTYPDFDAAARDLKGKTIEDLVDATGAGVVRSTTDAPGLSIGDVAVDGGASVCAGSAADRLAAKLLVGSPGGFTAQQVQLARAAYARRLGTVMAASDVRGAFRAAVRKLVRDGADELAKLLPPTADGQPRSPHELVALLRRDVTFALRVRQVVADTLVAPFADQLGSELAAAVPEARPADLAALHEHVGQLDVHDRLLADGGVVHAYVEFELVAKASEALTLAECNALVAGLQTHIDGEAKVLRQERVARDGIDRAKAERLEEWVEKDRRVKELETKVEEMTKRQESFRDVGGFAGTAADATRPGADVVKAETKVKDLARPHV